MKLCLFAFLLTVIAGCTAYLPSFSHQTDNIYFIRHDYIRLLDTDPLGHVYVVDREDRLIKFDSTRQQMFTVVNNNLGRVHSLDAGNPFKIMLFYRDQQTIVLYDRTLSELHRVPLVNWGFKDITAACLSPDNALWIFDGEKKVLLKMSDQGNSILTSDPFDIISPASIRPDFIFDFDHYLLLKETGKKVSIFNDFGNYLQSLDVDEDLFTVSGDQLIVNDGSAIQAFRLPGGEQIEYFGLQESWKTNRFYYLQGHYYLADDKGVYQIRFQ